MNNPVIIFGASGLGRAALEIFESNGNVVYGFLDDNKDLHNTEIDNIPVLGSTEDSNFLKLIGGKCEAFIASDDNKEKKAFTEMIVEDRKMMPVNAVHQSVILSKTSSLGHGNLVNSGSAIGAGTEIGNHCLINSGVVIDHSCQIGDYVQIGVGAKIGANVEIGNGAFIGTGAVIVGGLKVGKSARVGAGSIVISSVDPKKTVFGNPAAELKK
ncbi:MAG: acetyltransferase [Reichenbachiella sp.]